MKIALPPELKKALIVGLFLTFLVYLLGYSGNNSYKVDFTPKELKSDIINIIKKTKFNDEKDFIENNSFSYITKSDIDKLLHNPNKIKDEELINIYFVVKDKFPTLISGGIKKESERWSRWMYIVIIYLLTTLFSWVFLYLISNKFDFKKQINDTLEDWLKKNENTVSDIYQEKSNELIKIVDEKSYELKNEVNNHFVEIIQDFANAHPGFIKGMYDNYPEGFIKIFDKKNVSDQLKKLHSDSSTKSLYFWMKEVDVTAYSEFAQDLLNYTNKNIFSTTYFDNSDLITALMSDKVMDWINAVKNRKEQNNSIDIVRVHIFKDGVNDTDPKSFKGFINLLNDDKNKKAKDNYLKYADDCDYKIWLIIKDMERHFFGEYIIFDEQVMIQYDEDFKKLELYIGPIVKRYSKQFRKKRIKYFVKNKKELTSILKP